MIKFKNINGDVFLAVGSIKRKSALNGEKSLSGTLFEGDDVLNKIDKGWSLDFDNEPYVVTYFERNDNDNTVEFDAIHKFFWDMNKDVLYFSWSGSHTAKAYLDQIFKDTGYQYALNFEPSAFEKDNWGMKNKLSLFNDAIDSMGGEFEINGTLVSIFKNVGSDLSTIVRHGFNLSDMSLENDNTDFVTYGEGFGAYTDQENQTGERLHVTYTSPLAKTFGKLHAEPIDDQRYTIKDNLLQAIKDKVDGSFAISIKLSLYDLTAAGYPYKMANVGDWLLAIDENLDFKQKIRIISVDDEFATDGTRISYTVTCGDIGVVQKYQQANASLGQKVDSAYQNAQDAKESSIQAVIAANGKNTNYYVDGVENLPTTANEGDIAFVQTGDGQAMYIWTKMPDGSFKWVKRVDPDTGEQIAAGVDSAIETANSQAAAAIEQNNASQQEVMNDIAKSQANLAIKDGDFNNKAQAMADKALSDAKANAANVAQETLNSANQNIADAKKSLSDSIASEASERQQAVQTVNSQAQSYANQAKSDAIAAAETADGVVRKDFKATTDSLSSTITQNKQDSDGKISTAQSTATQALNGLSTKVSQTDYDKKTGDLSTNVNTVTQTANETKNELANVSKTVDSQSSKINTISNTVDGTTQTISDIQKEQGKQSGSIATLQQRADGFDGTVAKIQMSVNDLGQVNLLNNTEFNPNLEGWSINQSGGAQLPYRSYVQNDLKSVVVSFDTTNTTSVAYTRFVQNFKLASVPSSGNKISISWASYAKRVDNYNNVWIHFYDVNGKDVYSTYKAWSAIGNDNTWGNRKKWEGITIPDTATSVVISFEVREGTQADLGQPMVTYGATIGDYVPGNYNNNDSLSQVKLTADQATLSINNYKTDADGRIRKAQADIEVNANAITQKVSQSVYDKKTGDLTTSVNNAQSTADTATQTIGTYKETNDKRVASAEANIKANSDAIKLTVSKTDFDEETGKLSGDITTLQQRANGFDATVTKVDNLSVGGRNYLLNSNILINKTSSAATVQVSSNYINQSVTPDFYSNKKITASVYIKYTNITSINTNPSFKRIVFAVSFKDDSGNVRYLDAQKTVSVVGDSYEGRISNTIDLSGFSVSSVPTCALYIQNIAADYIEASNPKLEIGTAATDWSPAPEDTENKISTVSQRVEGISSIVSDPTTGLTKRVQTAEGLLTQVRGTDIPNLQKATFWQPYSSLNFNDYTKQGSFFFNTSSAKTNGPTTSTSWIYLIVEQGTTDNSRIKQTAWYDGVSGVKITYVRTLNSGTWSPWYANDNDSVATISHTNESIKKEIENRTTGDKNTFESSKDFTSSEISKSETNMKSLIDQKADSIIIGTMSNSIDQLKSVTNWQEISFNNLDYLQQTGNYLITQSDNTNFPPGVTAWVYLKVESPRSDRVTQTLWKDLNATQSYVRTLNGTNWSAWSQQVTSSTILGIFKDSWSLGTSTNDGITKQMITGIMGQPDGTLILKGNSLILDGNTTVTGDFYAKGGNFKNLNASNITTGTINAAKINVINIDVSNLSGNITNFIKSYWDSAYSNVTIDSTGMTIKSGALQTKFKNGSIGIQTKLGENLGFIGTDQLVSNETVDFLTIALNGYHTTKPGDSHYDYGASDFYGGDGFSFEVSNDSGTYTPKLRWNSDYSAGVQGIDSGWTFYDKVYFDRGLYAHGAPEYFRVSWTAWSDWGNYRNVSFTNPNGSAGIAVNRDNLILFGTNKRTDGTKGWNV